MVNQSTRILFLLFLWFLPHAMQAQIVEWSNQQKLRSKTNYTRVIGENASGLYVARAKNSDFNRDVIIEKYKNNLALENSMELDMPSGTYIEKFLLQSDGIAVISSRKNDTVPKIDVSCIRINQALQMAKPKLLTRIDASVFKSNTAINFQASVNKSNYAMIYFTSGLEKSTSVLHMLGFDESMNPTYNKSFNIQFAPDDVVVSGFECDNDGNAYLLIDFPRAGDRS
jgi:hypothetical protein